MATHIWRRVKSGTPSTRVLSAYLALVLAVAVIGPGLTVYGSEGETLVVSPEEPVAQVEEEAGLGQAEEVTEPDPAPVAEPDVATASIVAVATDSATPVAVEPSVEIMRTTSVVAPPVVLAPSALSADPSGLGIAPTLVDGNPALLTGGLRIDPGTSGVYAVPGRPGMFVTITVSSTPDGDVFSFMSGVPVLGVVAKGGNAANSYSYSGLSAGAVSADTNLHAPVNASGGYADLSHADFYFDPIVGPQGVHIIATKFHDDGGNCPHGVVGDGIRQGAEEWLGGFSFDLYSGPDSDGPWTYVMSATSVGANGQADFGEHPHGWYKIVEVLTPAQVMAGWYPTTSDGVKVFQTTGEYNGGLWFGNLQEVPESGDVKVYKFNDLNENGEYDDDEPMLEDWEFTLTQSTSVPAIPQ
ncbi:MAG: hypothetical protein RBS17_10735, partial [Coriobacteriia bacterium]|nr:hypothetical protein [Coriobacteriia bacterium]